MKGLATPYSRSDLAMIRQAIRNKWPIDEATRASILAELQRVEESQEGSPTYRKAVKTTFGLLSTIKSSMSREAN